ncbi:unnamed protein product [Amoebophrya sp. A120]|nr:unnamed protein product [Amoebophrya sp. A120]|eukprot:GSA120T00007710001.1
MYSATPTRNHQIEDDEVLVSWESSIGLKRNPVETKTGKTTLMLKNLLASQSQQDVLDMLAARNFHPGRSFDFFYLPIDFRSRSNYGYCFVNFVSLAEAKRFHAVFHQVSLHPSAPRKLSEVGIARVQGKKNNIEQFRNSPINAIPAAIAHYRPLIFDTRGAVQPFPEPDQTLPALQLRESRRTVGPRNKMMSSSMTGSGGGLSTTPMLTCSANTTTCGTNSDAASAANSLNCFNAAAGAGHGLAFAPMPQSDQSTSCATGAAATSSPLMSSSNTTKNINANTPSTCGSSTYTTTMDPATVAAAAQHYIPAGTTNAASQRGATFFDATGSTYFPSFWTNPALAATYLHPGYYYGNYAAFDISKETIITKNYT